MLTRGAVQRRWYISSSGNISHSRYARCLRLYLVVFDLSRFGIFTFTYLLANDIHIFAFHQIRIQEFEVIGNGEEAGYSVPAPKGATEPPGLRNNEKFT